MKHILACLLLTSCSVFGTGHEVDLVQLADKVELYRADIMDVVYPVAKPETQAALTKLSQATLNVEAALREAGAEGAITDWKVAASEALTIADQVIKKLQAQGASTGDAQAIVGLLKVLLRHLAAADAKGAAAV